MDKSASPRWEAMCLCKQIDRVKTEESSLKDINRRSELVKELLLQDQRPYKLMWVMSRRKEWWSMVNGTFMVMDLEKGRNFIVKQWTEIYVLCRTSKYMTHVSKWRIDGISFSPILVYLCDQRVCSPGYSACDGTSLSIKLWNLFEYWSYHHNRRC